MPSGELGDLKTRNCSSSIKQHFSLKAGSHAGADSVQAGGGSVQGAERRLGAAGWSAAEAAEVARTSVGGKREFRCLASSFPVTFLLLPDAVRRNVCQEQSLRDFFWYFEGFRILVDFSNCGKNKTVINFQDLVCAEDRGGSLVRTLCDGWPGRIVGALPKSSWIHPTCPFGERSKVFGKRRQNLDGGWTNVLANLLAQIFFFFSFFPTS